MRKPCFFLGCIFAVFLFFAEDLFAETVPFADAYQVMLARSLRVANQGLEVQASDERRLRAWGSLAPSISLDLSDSRGAEPAFGPTRSGALSASMNLWRSGGDLAGLRAAKKDQIAQRERLQSEKQKAEDDIVQTVSNFIAGVQRRQINEKLLGLQAESLRIARERYQKGLLAQQEVDKVLIDVENARAKLIDTETQEAEARANLKSALGHDRVSIEWPWREAIVKGPALELTEMRLEARPDWRSLENELAVQSLKRRQAYGSLLPTLDLTGSYGSADLSASERRDWKAVLTLSLPLFSGLRDQTAYRIQALAAQGAEYRLEALKRQAPAEIESLKKSHKAAREYVLAREKTAKLIERLYADSVQRFRLGRASVNDLSTDQNRLLQSQLLEIDGWTILHVSFAKLCHALGGSVAAEGRCLNLP